MQERIVELPDMLEAREQRYWAQRRLMERYHKTLICFTMNIAGPMKNNDAILRGFRMGQRFLMGQLESLSISVLFHAEITKFTGNEAFYVVDGEPMRVKGLTCEIEDNTGIGRLFDMDVLDAEGNQVSRKGLGLTERKCLICGGPAKVCSSRRVHSVAELQAKTADIFRETFQKEDKQRIGELAQRSLLYEVCTTPKPGLVDRNNSGSHKDMDIFTFMASSAALRPYFEECAEIGMDTAELSPCETFHRLRWAGKQAESAMKRATKGVNTHKGAVFSVGILCGALGRLNREAWSDPSRVLSECADMTRDVVEHDFDGVTRENVQTVGQRLYIEYGITGVRGQAAEGFPAVLNNGLPTLERYLNDGLSLNEAGCNTLLSLMTAATDTNLIARSDRETQVKVSEQIREMLSAGKPVTTDTLEKLDGEFIRQNLSPGGSADLLAMTYFLHFLKEDE